MTSPLTPDIEVLEASGVRQIHDVIDDLQRLGAPTGRGAEGYDELLTEIDRAIRRLGSLKLQVVATADHGQVADRAGLADTTSWLATRTRTGAAEAAKQVKLASALLPADEGERRPCATALASGLVSADHAQVIVKATEQLPSRLSAEEVDAVERELVAKATQLAPDQLRRVARRALAAVEEDQDAVDRHEDALLRTEEESALARTKLTWHDNGDGTTSGHFTVPTMAAAILTRTIQSMTAPRRARMGATRAQAGEPLLRQDWAHQSGLAFVELLEHLPTDHLHGKVAATVVVTIDHGRLHAAVGAAGLDTGDALSVGDLRRLACGAGILPAVLDGQSLPLDLGRASRLFTESQRVALATRHRTCAADGCERPFAWCELHHLVPWSHAGSTNLADAVPLCGFHHRRIHDPAYAHSRSAAGITFTRRSVPLRR